MTREAVDAVPLFWLRMHNNLAWFVILECKQNLQSCSHVRSLKFPARLFCGLMFARGITRMFPSPKYNEKQKFCTGIQISDDKSLHEIVFQPSEKALIVFCLHGLLG